MSNVRHQDSCVWLIGSWGAILVIYACLLLTKTHRFLSRAGFPWRRMVLRANHAASNKDHMHNADILHSGPGAAGRQRHPNLSPGGQSVVTLARSRFLSPPAWRSSMSGCEAGVCSGRHADVSRQGSVLNLRREIVFHFGLGEKSKIVELTTRLVKSQTLWLQGLAIINN